MEVLPYVMAPSPCSTATLSSSSSSSACHAVGASVSLPPSSALSPLTLASSAFFLPHTPGPACPSHCHSHIWQSSSASLSSQPSASCSVQSGRATASSMSDYSHSSASQPVSAAIESQFPHYHSIYPASTLPDMHDAHSITAIFKQEGFTEIYQWQDGPSTAYDAHTHPTHNAHYIFRGDLHVFYPQLNQSVYYKQGDRFDIPAELVHSTDMGQQGCVYMVASKRPEQRR